MEAAWAAAVACTTMESPVAYSVVRTGLTVAVMSPETAIRDCRESDLPAVVTIVSDAAEAVAISGPALALPDALDRISAR